MEMGWKLFLCLWVVNTGISHEDSATHGHISPRVLLKQGCIFRVNTDRGNYN